MIVIAIEKSRCEFQIRMNAEEVPKDRFGKKAKYDGKIPVSIFVGEVFFHTAV